MSTMRQLIAALVAIFSGCSPAPSDTPPLTGADAAPGAELIGRWTADDWYSWPWYVEGGTLALAPEGSGTAAFTFVCPDGDVARTYEHAVTWTPGMLGSIRVTFVRASSVGSCDPTFELVCKLGVSGRLGCHRPDTTMFNIGFSRVDGGT